MTWRTVIRVSEEFALATLEDASPENIKRLLELFPVSVLKRNWSHLKGNKPELCGAIAGEADHGKIGSFIVTNFARCKQHAYVFEARGEDGPNPADALPEIDCLGIVRGQTEVYLGTAKYTVLLRDPFAQEELELLWPMRIDYQDAATVVSFVVLERDVGTFFEREVINVRRHVDEKDVVLGVSSLGYKSIDLNKGVKALWAEDFFDAFRSKFKKARSTTTEAMDQERGIKVTVPQLYEQMQRLPIFETMFRVNPDVECAVEVFQANPTDGSIKMTRYTERGGDSDEIIHKILEKNF